jgi:hypothetical protein
MFVGAKHDLRQYGIITNNLYAVMLLQASKTRCTLTVDLGQLTFKYGNQSVDASTSLGFIDEVIYLGARCGGCYIIELLLQVVRLTAS